MLKGWQRRLRPLSAGWLSPRQVHLIAKARIKTDVIDAMVLARLYASGFLPEVWVPDQ